MAQKSKGTDKAAPGDPGLQKLVKLLKGAKRKIADTLIELSTRASLFHAPNGTGFATLPVGNHRETWPVSSKGFRRWLAREFFNETKSAPNQDALQAALNVIEARAHFEGPERAVFVRVGAHNGAIYLALADAEWRAIEIDAHGWRIVAQAPIPLRRPAGLLALPEPVRGGKIEELRPFLNVSDDDEFVLTVSFELAAMR